MIIKKLSDHIFKKFKYRFINLSCSNLCENITGSKIIKVEIDKDGNKKLIYENFDEHIKNKLDDPNSKYGKISNKISKLKIFGSENKNIIDDITTSPITQDNLAQKEEITENLINYDQYFSDQCRIYIKAGDGGNGLISFIKGPMFNDRTAQGGDGGKGGDVIFIADETVNSLSSLRKAHYVGNNGEKGYIKSMNGKFGGDIRIQLPVGTIVNEIIREEDYNFKKKDLRSGQKGKIRQVVDLDEHGKTFVICKGGRGGIGNVTKRNITADSKAQKGQPGEEKELELVLKCIADVGFIGYPNAGKSTLLAALTRAVPKIASYPFTTLHPHIGKLNFSESFSLRVTDLPGLIEGAHQNKGLGHKFLKHIERTKILLFLLDGSLNPYEQRSPLNDILSLFSELSLYNKEFKEKPFLVALNKYDIAEAESNFKTNLDLLSKCDLLRGKDILPISGKEGIGLEELACKIKQIADKIISSTSTSEKAKA